MRKIRILERRFNTAVDALSSKISELELSNATLKDEITALASTEIGTSELEGELTRMRAQREADVEEVNAILNQLTPLVEGS